MIKASNHIIYGMIWCLENRKKTHVWGEGVGGAAGTWGQELELKGFQDAPSRTPKKAISEKSHSGHWPYFFQSVLNGCCEAGPGTVGSPTSWCWDLSRSWGGSADTLLLQPLPRRCDSFSHRQNDRQSWKNSRSMKKSFKGHGPYTKAHNDAYGCGVQLRQAQTAVAGTKAWRGGFGRPQRAWSQQ